MQIPQNLTKMRTILEQQHVLDTLFAGATVLQITELSSRAALIPAHYIVGVFKQATKAGTSKTLKRVGEHYIRCVKRCRTKITHRRAPFTAMQYSE